MVSIQDLICIGWFFMGFFNYVAFSASYDEFSDNVPWFIHGILMIAAGFLFIGISTLYPIWMAGLILIIWIVVFLWFLKEPAMSDEMYERVHGHKRMT